MRTSARPLLYSTVIAAMLLVTTAAYAGPNPEEVCQKGLYSAAAKYDACEQKMLAKSFGWYPDQAKLPKCRIKYAQTWAKLQAKASGSGSTCDAARFTDNGDGTVTDRLTRLQWEQKTNDATVHDKDNPYTWSAGGGGFTAPDGTAFTSFLTALNGGVCFAGQCDWRLPTRREMQTILLPEPYPYSTSPCIDQAAFGPTVSGYYWLATALASTPTRAWAVGMGLGDVGIGPKSDNNFVRAVRGGL